MQRSAHRRPPTRCGAHVRLLVRLALVLLMAMAPRDAAAGCNCNCAGGKYCYAKSVCVTCSATCPSGNYKAGCSCNSGGSCRVCKYTACSSGKYRTGCGGLSSGSCSNCAKNCGSGRYRKNCGGTNRWTSAGSCVTCAACSPGKRRINCRDLSAGSCTDCTTACAAGHYFSSGCTCAVCPTCPGRQESTGCTGSSPGSCVDFDECAAGVHNCDAQAQCTNTAGSFTCACGAGWNTTGGSDGAHCEDVDECRGGTHDCDVSRSICKNTLGSFTCACNAGFESTDAAAAAGAWPYEVRLHDWHPQEYECVTAGFSTVLHEADATSPNCTACDECRHPASVLHPPHGGLWALAPAPVNGSQGQNGVWIVADLGRARTVTAVEYSALHCPLLEISSSLGSQVRYNPTSLASAASGVGSQGLSMPITARFVILAPQNCSQGFAVYKALLSFAPSGANCTDRDECVDQTHNCDPARATCANTNGSFFCTCNAGWAGNGTACANVDECTAGTHDCNSTRATCTDAPGSFSCACNAGWAGDGHVCGNADECATGAHDCDAAHGTCSDTVGSFECGCHAGWERDRPHVYAVHPETWWCGTGWRPLGLGVLPNECSEIHGPQQAFLGGAWGWFPVDGSNPYTLDVDLQRVRSIRSVQFQSWSGALEPGAFYLWGSSDGVLFPGPRVDVPSTASGALQHVDVLPPLESRYVRVEFLSSQNFYLTKLHNLAFGFADVDTTCYDINECLIQPLMTCDREFGLCSNTQGSFLCTCPVAGYGTPLDNGTRCGNEHECAEGTHDCDSAHALCANTPGSFTCTCNAGWQSTDAGRTCLDVNECTLLPNASATACLPAHGRCVNVPGTYECECHAGWAASANNTNCSTNADECAQDTHNCAPGASVCTDTPGSFVCACSPGFLADPAAPPGVACADVAECSDPQLHSCRGPHVECVETRGSFECHCAAGWVSRNTSHPPSPGANASNASAVNASVGRHGTSLECSNIDECADATHNCAAGAASCTDTDGSFTCACNAGFDPAPGAPPGVACIDIDECANETLRACAGDNVECVNTRGAFVCQCQQGWGPANGSYNNATSGNGTFSDASRALHCVNVDECAETRHVCPPAGVGTCTDSSGSFVCTCLPGWAPVKDAAGHVVNCSNLDECAIGAHACGDHRAECSDTPGSFACVCPAGFDWQNGTLAPATPGNTSASPNATLRGNATLTCVDTDECTSRTDTCDRNTSSCSNTAGSFLCVCQPGAVPDPPTEPAHVRGCRCPNGTYAATGHCLLCPAGAYCRDGLARPCPANLSTPRAGADAPSDCACLPPRVLFGGLCVGWPCARGEYVYASNVSGVDACACTAGRFRADTNASTRPGECVPCPAGFFCPGGLPERDPRPCPNGTTSLQSAAYEDNCSTGVFMQFTFSNTDLVALNETILSVEAALVATTANATSLAATKISSLAVAPDGEVVAAAARRVLLSTAGGPDVFLVQLMLAFSATADLSTPGGPLAPSDVAALVEHTIATLRATGYIRNTTTYVSIDAVRPVPTNSSNGNSSNVTGTANSSAVAPVYVHTRLWYTQETPGVVVVFVLAPPVHAPVVAHSVASAASAGAMAAMPDADGTNTTNATTTTTPPPSTTPPADDTPTSSSSLWMWVALGCGGTVVVLLVLVVALLRRKRPKAPAPPLPRDVSREPDAKLSAAYAAPIKWPQLQHPAPRLRHAFGR